MTRSFFPLVRLNFQSLSGLIWFQYALFCVVCGLDVYLMRLDGLGEALMYQHFIFSFMLGLTLVGMTGSAGSGHRVSTIQNGEFVLSRPITRLKASFVFSTVYFFMMLSPPGAFFLYMLLRFGFAGASTAAGSSSSISVSRR